MHDILIGKKKSKRAFVCSHPTASSSANNGAIEPFSLRTEEADNARGFQKKQ